MQFIIRSLHTYELKTLTNWVHRLEFRSSTPLYISNFICCLRITWNVASNFHKFDPNFMGISIRTSSVD